MAVRTHSNTIYEVHSESDLSSLALENTPFYILGEGSNTLFIDEQTPMLVKPIIKGIKVTETADSFELTVGAGENWHQLVKYTVDNGMPGLENLALIPGSVGAAPVQNIGAYGVEFSQFCQSVRWFCLADKQIKELSNKECEFGYRESVFKQALKGQGIITTVHLSLPKTWHAKLSYQGLDQLDKSADAKTVMARVIDIRNSKLPDPQILPNNGSFFKNPVVDANTFKTLIAQYPKMPYYNQTDDSVKLAAGWLIEQAGLKGYRHEDVGIHDKQALVIVNYDKGTGKQVLSLARYIIDHVSEKFNITLEPEVRLVTSSGEKTMAELKSYV